MLADPLLRWSSIHPILFYGLLFIGWPPIIHVVLQLAKHILMLGHCLRRFPNFNPTMGWNASCFLAREKHLPPSPVISALLASFIQSQHWWHWHRKQCASVTYVGPALNQHWFKASCWLCLAINGLEQYWATVCESDGSIGLYIAYLINCSHMLGIVPLPYTCTRRSANVRPALQMVSQH